MVTRQVPQVTILHHSDAVITNVTHIITHTPYHYCCQPLPATSRRRIAGLTKRGNDAARHQASLIDAAKRRLRNKSRSVASTPGRQPPGAGGGGGAGGTGGLTPLQAPPVGVDRATIEGLAAVASHVPPRNEAFLAALMSTKVQPDASTSHHSPCAIADTCSIFVSGVEQAYAQEHGPAFDGTSEDSGAIPPPSQQPRRAESYATRKRHSATPTMQAHTAAADQYYAQQEQQYQHHYDEYQHHHHHHMDGSTAPTPLPARRPATAPSERLFMHAPVQSMAAHVRYDGGVQNALNAGAQGGSHSVPRYASGRPHTITE